MNITGIKTADSPDGQMALPNLIGPVALSGVAV